MRSWTGSAAAVLAVSFMIALVRRDVAADPPRWQLHVKPGAYSAVAFAGEKAEYELALENATNEDREVEVRLRSTSDVGEKWGKDWKLEIAAGKEHTEKVTHPSGEIGYWAIRIQVIEDGEAVALEQQVSPGQYTTRDYFESGLMVVSTPPSYGKRDPENYFGLIFMEDFESTERLGVKNMMPYPDWGTFEPTPGNYRYNWLDSFFREAEEHNMEVMLKLNHWPMPHWPCGELEEATRDARNTTPCPRTRRSGRTGETTARPWWSGTRASSWPWRSTTNRI